MAPPWQAISILLAASMLVMMVSSLAELAEPPSLPLIQLSPTTVAASARMHPSNLLYSMQFRIGNTLVSGIADTGSDLIWTNNSQLLEMHMDCCNGLCSPCDANKQEMSMKCCNGLIMFERKYAGGVGVKGFMGEAKLTFGDRPSYTTPALNIGSAVMFGCHLSDAEKDKDKKTACKPYKAGGVVGLGNGELSLVTQLGLHNFSLCIPGSQQTGLIKFNDSAALPMEGRQEMELVTFEGGYPLRSRYYAKVKSVEVNRIEKVPGTHVEIPNGCFENKDRSNGDGGMVIDSGTPTTRLPKKALDNVKTRVNQLMKDKYEKEPNEIDGLTCYPGTELPKNIGDMVLHFEKFKDQEAQMVLPVENYMFLDKAHSKVCLAIKEALSDSPEMSILGIYQLQNIHMFFDIKNKNASFVKHTTCGQSEEKKHAAV